MNTASFNISKNLTIITDINVYSANFSNLILEASKFNVIDLKGVTSTVKLNKYLSVLLSAGFSILTENWNRENEIADGVSDFSITLTK